MNKIRIDFAPGGLRRTLSLTSPAAWALLLGSLFVAVLLIGSTVTYRQRLDEHARLLNLAAMHEPRMPAPPAPPRKTVPKSQAAAVNAIVLQLNVPWRAMHDAVQAATPVNIALLALEPDARKSIVRVTAEAKNSEDMIAYVEVLKQQAWFSSVNLTHHEINEQDPNRPIRFQLDADWGTP